MKTSEVLERALALIADEQHWIQGISKMGNRYCLSGAIEGATRSRKSMIAAYGQVREQLSHNRAERPISDWNDSKRRKYADVRRVLEQAIAHAQAEEASRG